MTLLGHFCIYLHHHCNRDQCVIHRRYVTYVTPKPKQDARTYRWAETSRFHLGGTLQVITCHIYFIKFVSGQQSPPHASRTLVRMMAPAILSQEPVRVTPVSVQPHILAETVNRVSTTDDILNKSSSNTYLHQILIFMYYSVMIMIFFYR